MQEVSAANWWLQIEKYLSKIGKKYTHINPEKGKIVGSNKQ